MHRRQHTQGQYPPGKGGGQQNPSSEGLGLECPLLILICDNTMLQVWLSGFSTWKWWSCPIGKAWPTKPAQLHSTASSRCGCSYPWTLSCFKGEKGFSLILTSLRPSHRRYVGIRKLCLCPLSPRRGRASSEASGGNCWYTTPQQNVLFSFSF